MKLKNFVLLLLSLTLFCAYKQYETKSQITNQKNESTNLNDSSGILIINSELGFGGREVHTINLYRTLKKHDLKPILLVAKDSELEAMLKKLEIPFYSTHTGRIFGFTYHLDFSKNISKVCKDEKIALIHCNIVREVPYATKVSHELNIKIILTQHVDKKIKIEKLKGIDGIIGVNKDIIKTLSEQLQDKIIPLTCIPPFFDDERFLNFNTTESKADFFKKNFNLDFQTNFLVSCVACLSQEKNQQLLIKALSILQKQNKNLFDIVLVGQGKMQENLQKLAEELELSKYVHFLGFSNLIPEILYHSDINLLTSRNEALGIALLEGGLLKKPLIGPTNTGVSEVIIDNETGLIFENNNEADLAEKLDLLLTNKELREKLGNAAFEHIKENFSSNASLQKLKKFYENL